MSIRLLAIELYRLTREVERLERELETAAPSQRAAAARELAMARADRQRLRRALDGWKDSSRSGTGVTR